MREATIRMRQRLRASQTNGTNGIGACPISDGLTVSPRRRRVHGSQWSQKRITAPHVNA
jgi:hypothetical protein